MKTQQIEKMKSFELEISNQDLVLDKLYEVILILKSRKQKSIFWVILLVCYLAGGFYVVLPEIQSSPTNFLGNVLVPIMYFGYLVSLLLFLYINLSYCVFLSKFKCQLISILKVI